jgi:hypothetical protein
MYSVILAAVNGDGSVGITGSGQTLRCIGNKTVYAGQTVDTDGRYIYGNMSTRGSSFVPIAAAIPYVFAKGNLEETPGSASGGGL